MFQNIVIGTPLDDVERLFARDHKDWELNEKKITLFTEERFLPKALKEAGIVPSIGEVRRNRPELVRTLNEPDFLQVKWGKKFVFIAVGK